jgi:hypothetical protein
MLGIDVEANIFSECTSVVLVIFDKVQNDFFTLLIMLWIFQIDGLGLDACPALHYGEDCGHQIPCFLQIVMFDWDMKFPVLIFIWKLVLSMPVHPATKFGIHLDEAIIA